MTRMAPPRLHRPSLILSCHEDGHEVIVTIHFSLNVSLFQTNNYCENGRSDWPGTDDLVCQPVTLTKGKSLLWLVAPVAGLAAARPPCTPGQNRFLAAQSDSGAGGDNLSLARLSRYLLMPGTPVHGTRERPERERGVRVGAAARAGPLGTAGLGILHKGDSFHVEKKVCYLGPGLSCQCLSESGWGAKDVKVSL